jgi:8-oxo-dGTP diphosphatase
MRAAVHTDPEPAQPTPETAHLAVDLAVLGMDHTGLVPEHVLLIQRRHDPHAGSWALPGGLVDQGEGIFLAAARELAEETGLRLGPAEMHLAGVYDEPGRDPRGRVVSVAYLAMVDGTPAVAAGDDAATARWTSIADVMDGRVRLAFDHHRILRDAVAQAFCQD